MWPNITITAQFAPPPTLVATAVSAGYAHACSIAADTSECVCWGANRAGQATPPPSLGPVKAVSAGLLHSCVVTQAGKVACFGYNGSNQTNVPDGLEAGATAVAAGSDHSAALLMAHPSAGVPTISANRRRRRG
jgi:alpha-tubulin suppressor-like RCC1 family protein